MSNADDVVSHQNDQSDHDEEDDPVPVLNERAKKSSGKTFRRQFVYLHKRLDSVPQKSRLESLQKETHCQRNRPSSPGFVPNATGEGFGQVSLAKESS